jgi:hypothetical protein
MRIIYCHSCSCKVGEIQDGSLLMKGIRYTCTKCVTKEDSESYDANIFGDLFGTEKGKSADFWDDLADKFKGFKNDKRS